MKACPNAGKTALYTSTNIIPVTLLENGVWFCKFWSRALTARNSGERHVTMQGEEQIAGLNAAQTRCYQFLAPRKTPHAVW